MWIWDRWDDEEKASAIKITGLCIAALAVFVLLSGLSYLFTWKQDMSLLGDASMMDVSKTADNAAGKLGCKTGRFLIGECFGLGSFAIVFILGVYAARLMLGKWSRPLVKTTVVALLAAFVSSLALSWAGSLLGLGSVFGGGLGGRVGAMVAAWAGNLVGVPMTGFFILILVVCLLFYSSKRFTVWFSGLGKRLVKESQEEEAIPAPETETIVEEVEEIVPEPETEAIVEEVEEIVPEPAGPAPSGVEIIRDDAIDQEVTRDLPPINNRLDMPDGLPKYRFPSLDLLESHASARHDVSTEELQRNNNKIRCALNNYKIQIVNVKAIVGPTVTLYKVYPAPGVKISEIKRLQEDIALSLNARGVRVVTLSDSVGIEVANDFPSIVPLKSLLNDDAFRGSKADLPVAIGYTITQDVKVFDLADAPHLLIAGATKQGKSVGLNVIVSSLLYSKHPSELKFVFIDPKMVEFSAYGGLLKHYLAVMPDAGDEEEERKNAIVKKPKDAERILQSLCTEMDERYELLSRAGVNNIKLYNEKYKSRKLNPKNGHKFLPYLVVVVDEYADLTMTIGASAETRASSKSITNSIIRLAQKGRAAGLHVILATQRPSVDVISGIIKSNFPMRIAFRVASRIDSMTILDAPGAEKLIGKGDMLFSAGIESERIQCAYISGAETDALTEFVSSQQGYAKSYNTPYYLPAIEEAGSEGGGMVDMKDLDERFSEAARMVVTTQKGSTSDLQRKLGMGYAKAGRVMDQLEAAGIVGPQEGSKPRQVLVSSLDELEPILKAFMK